MLPESRGSNYILRVISVYKDLFKDKYGFAPTISFGKFGKMTKTLVESHTELQIAAMLIIFFNWAGMDGNDVFQQERMVNSAHSFGWFFSTTNQYEIYLRNIQGLNLDNEDETRAFVASTLLALK